MVFRQKKWHLSIRIQSGKRKKTAKFWRSKRKKQKMAQKRKMTLEEREDTGGEEKKTFMKERAVVAIQ